MNRFAPDHSGGGGIGFAIQCYCTAEVGCIKNGVAIDYGRSSIIENFVAVFKKTVGYTVGPSIAVVTGLDKNALEKILKPLGLQIAITTKVDNEGLKIFS